MILTTEMWHIKQRIEFLKMCIKNEPDDYLAQFEHDELLIKFNKLDRRERIGLKVLDGGKLETK